ncbi:MAG: arginine repressor [Syntrophomonadaceae bacterium]|mgnify:CR=1 FL=1|nr:arginine repressor [Syntrophomonadaceae bacterium]
MKLRRQFAIMDIIANHRITTQEDLNKALKEAGFKVTQATISRDIKELQLVKIPFQDSYRYALPETTTLKGTEQRMVRVFKDSVININYSENIIVIRTMPGAAQSVASVIDNADMPNILGSVAGDDTIIVVVKPISAVEKVLKDFNRMIRE